MSIENFNLPEVEEEDIDIITLSDEDMKKINELEDSASYGSNPFAMAGRMTTATANAMETAAGNEAGAITGFMGMLKLNLTISRNRHCGICTRDICFSIENILISAY